MKCCSKGDTLFRFLYIFFPWANLKGKMNKYAKGTFHELEMNRKGAFKTKFRSLIFPYQQSRGFPSPHVILHHLTLYPDLLLSIPNLWLVFYDLFPENLSRFIYSIYNPYWPPRLSMCFLRFLFLM